MTMSNCLYNTFQARDSQRQLRNEFDDSTNDLQSQSARLNTLVEDIAKLQAVRRQLSSSNCVNE